jgi:hypothetical protein
MSPKIIAEELRFTASISQGRTALSANGDIEGGFTAKFAIPEINKEQFKCLTDWRNDAFEVILVREKPNRYRGTVATPRNCKSKRDSDATETV